ncbi:MAG: phosphatidylserine decarboxylase [Sulfurimonas sp.]|jgi:phosphatidylserine decarboxylase
MNQHFTSSLSKVFGKFASKKHSKKFQIFINRTYVNMMGLDMSDFNAPESYPTLNALFTRNLNKPRSFEINPSLLISPCDSLITEVGTIQDDRALQIKGMSYSVDEFLGDDISPENKGRIHGGEFINFYLSPRDYHRYHVPLDMQVTKAIHIPGKLYPVNIPTLKRKINLFIENERVVLECLTTHGKLFYLVLVGALNVGKMEVAFEPRIQTNTTFGGGVYEYANLHLKKGDDFGCFQMGSTIIFLSEKGMIESDVMVGSSVKFGQTVGRVF